MEDREQLAEFKQELFNIFSITVGDESAAEIMTDAFYSLIITLLKMKDYDSIRKLLIYNTNDIHYSNVLINKYCFSRS
jgi:hypothetical protein